ncbi:MAG TPA: hypothetical protein VK176_05120, partial [Phycisphaerales bacterium]|nr:hypothetical protein [Phycisphaerales bacterium]
MARTSTSLGMGVTVAILGALSLGLFIAFAVFFGKWNNLNAEKMAEQSVTEQFINTAERNRDDVNRQLANAKGERKSLVGYLLEGQQSVMSKVTGVSTDTLPQLEQKLASLNAGGAPLLTVARDQAARISQLEEALASADAERLKALADKKSEVDRVGTIVKSYDETIAALNEQINQYKDEITRYREGTDTARKEMDARIESLDDTIAKLRDEADRERAALQEKILI